MTLEEARFHRRLTQLDLRLRTGIHQSKISLIENGYACPRQDEKERIAKALGVKVDQIEWPQSLTSPPFADDAEATA